MAFVFTVEDGTGLVAGANSYSNVADADCYFEPDSRSATWDALSTTDKENLLAVATRTLDVYANFNGTKTVAASPLRWPRTGVCDRDGNQIGSNVIPDEIKTAVYELSRVLIGTDLNALNETDGIKKIVVDVIEVEFQEGSNMNGVAPQRIPNIVNAALNGLGRFNYGRRQFSRITRA
jgi:hypothetical protein